MLASVEWKGHPSQLFRPIVAADFSGAPNPREAAWREAICAASLASASKPRAARSPGSRHERSPPMHVGLATGFAHQRGDAYPDAQFVREEIDNLVLAEELGFDSVWITEHHFSDYSMSNDPVQLLTYVAARTKHVKLGTQCIIVPWHHPVRLAERIVNLDILSGGGRSSASAGAGAARVRRARDRHEPEPADVQRPARDADSRARDRRDRRAGPLRQHPQEPPAPGPDQELRGPQVLRQRSRATRCTLRPGSAAATWS